MANPTSPQSASGLASAALPKPPPGAASGPPNAGQLPAAGSPANPNPPANPAYGTESAAQGSSLTASPAVAGVRAGSGGEMGDRQFGLPLCFARLPVGLSVAVPVREFRVRNLLAISAGEVIVSHWAQGEDLPLSSGDVQLAWTEFEVVDNRIAVRVTRLA